MTRLATTLKSAAFALVAAAGLSQTALAQPVQIQNVPLEGPITWPTATNAAPIYWRAFYSFQTNEQLKGTDFSAMLDEGDASGYFLSEEEVEKCRSAQEVVQTALRAASVEPCSWEVDYEQGIMALLPHLGPTRNLARLFSADIRRCVQEGDIEGGLERIIAMHSMARHMRVDGILISSLVSCAIANLATTQTSLFLAHAELTKAQQDRLIAAIDAYEQDPFAVQQAVANEGNWLTAWLAEQVRSGEFRSSAADFTSMIGAGHNDEAMFKIMRLSDDALMEDLRSIRRYYTDAHALWNERDAGDRLEMLGELVEQGHYGTLAQVLTAALSKCHTADTRGQEALETSRAEVLNDPIKPEQPSVPAGR